MASFASSATTGGACKYARTKKEEEKIGENNGQLHFRPPPRVAHTSRLDQKTKVGLFFKCNASHKLIILGY